MKTIWIINHYAEPPEGGKYLRHFTFARKLINRGYKVKIFTASTVHNTEINHREDGKTYVEKNIQGAEFVFVATRSYFGNSSTRALNMLDYFFGVQKAVKDFGSADVIYSSGPHPLAWLAARKIADRLGAKLLIETRDLWPETFVSMGKMSKHNPIALILYALEKSIYKRADRLIFTLPGGKDYIEQLGLDTGKVRYINNGIELEEFNQKIEEYKYYNEKFSDFKGFKCVFTGAMGRANRVDAILRAAKEIKEQGIDDIKFYIFGHGAEEENLKKLKDEENITNLEFMGRVEKNYIPSILAQAELNILTLANLPGLFKYGLSPNKLFEYFASGRPTISNVPCGYDLLVKYGAGTTVDAKDPKYLAEGIINYYKMPKAEYDRVSQNALEAAKEYDFEILTDKLVEAIEK